MQAYCESMAWLDAHQTSLDGGFLNHCPVAHQEQLHSWKSLCQHRLFCEPCVVQRLTHLKQKLSALYRNRQRGSPNCGVLQP
jgi:hypothetical protein